MLEPGKTYTEQYLTDVEKAIINAYRDGARIHVVFDNQSNPEEAIAKVNTFAEVKNIWDIGEVVTFMNWESVSNLSVSAYLDK